MDKPPTTITTTHSTRNDDYYYSKFQSFSSKNVYKKSFLSSHFCLPTSLIAILVILIISYNSFTIFYYIPVFSLENVKETAHNLHTTSQLSSSETRFSMEDLDSPLFSKTTRFISSHKSKHQKLPTIRIAKQVHKPPTTLVPHLMTFSKRVRRFFNDNSCRFRVFMTWISKIDSFGEREKFTIESLFKHHPYACLIIVSSSMDSIQGTQILEPFSRLDFKVMAVSPDFKFIFKNTMADYWFTQLQEGKIKRGDIAIGQNLSNLLRLALLYKYGGVYMDTDFIVIKRLDSLRNVIGAQTADAKTKNWLRLNNALMIFDKKHPLLNKFIEEFALTFNGNKWGHNGPYLVSRVVERVVNGSIAGAGEFTILPPTAFYVVNWAHIGNLFKKPADTNHSMWVNHKLNQIVEESYAIHLWNRQSRDIVVEDESIISHLIRKSCVFCNFSRTIS